MRYPNKRSRVQFPADSPVEAGTLETVARFSFFGFRVTFLSAIRFPDPLSGFTFDADPAKQVSLTLVMFALPVFRANGFIQNAHIATRVLIEQEGDALVAHGGNAGFHFLCD